MATHPAAGAATAAGTADDAGDAHCRTFAIAGEDHTLGNALAVALNRLPAVTFAGYTVPHPAEPVVHVRVQTSPESGVTAPQALKQAAAGAHSHCASLCIPLRLV
jgi:DNA-directed RNA polymerases I and III subunit RPAC2